VNRTGFDLDLAEVRARRAAGETSPIGSAELALKEGNQIPDALRSLESLRERNQDFRFASEVGQFGEPVFDNDSIERLQEVQENDNESLRGGFGISQAPDISPDQRISDRLALGLISEEDARQQRQRLTDQENTRSENLRTVTDARIAAAEARGDGSAGSNVFVPRTNEDGQVIVDEETGRPETRINPNASQEDFNEAAKTFGPRFRNSFADLGFESVDAAVGDFAEFLGNTNQNADGSEVISEEAAFDVYRLNRALAQESGVNTPNNFQTGIANLAEFFATEDSRFLRSDAGTIGGTTVSVNAIPESIRGELNDNRQRIEEQMQGRLDTSIGQEFNSKLVGSFADQAKEFGKQLSRSTFRPSDIASDTGITAASRRNQITPETAQQFTPTLDEFRKDANELSTRISNGDQDVTPDEIQAIKARFQAIQEQLAENQRVRNVLGIAPEDLRN